ncbi:MAG: DUF1957 domain-containing protein [Thermoleophilaceae bacterium]|nr:DUF1957 domain-containing protein [Thermoleophilaceae bacterium]
MSKDRGQLALVLHSHMPYVEGFGTWPGGEEWLWEAWADCYARLFDVIEGQPVTLSLTPVLCDQFESLRGSAGDRMLRWVREVREHLLEEDIDGFTRVDCPGLAAEMRRQLAQYRASATRFEGELGRDLIAVCKRLASSGVELWTSAYTHAIVPLLATDFGVDLQIGLGAQSHRERFGEWSGGFWLPECAYRPGIEPQLARNGVGYFCVDQTNQLGLGSLDHLQPSVTESDLVALPIDWQTVSKIWAMDGYPVAAPYRSSFRRSMHSHMPWRNDGGDYDPRAARTQADAHAKEFVEAAAARLDEFRQARGRPGLLTCAVDTELLGHWWYEGPWFLQSVFEHAKHVGLVMTTAASALENAEPVPRMLGTSSWGKAKDLSTWDAPSVQELAWRTRSAELQLHDLMAAIAAGASQPDHQLNQETSEDTQNTVLRAARELLAMQSSDWAFQISNDKADAYARGRFEGHAAHFAELVTAVSQSSSAVQSPHTPVDPQLANLAPALNIDTLKRFLCGH